MYVCRPFPDQIDIYLKVLRRSLKSSALGYWDLVNMHALSLHLNLCGLFQKQAVDENNWAVQQAKHLKYESKLLIYNLKT